MIFLFFIYSIEYIGARNGRNNNKWWAPEPSFDAKTINKKKGEMSKNKKRNVFL